MIKWGKVLLATIGGALAGTVGQWANTTMSGGHEAFTTHTILFPALATILSTLLALFTEKPVA